MLSLIQIDNIILYQALGPQKQEEEEALGLPLFISYILFFLYYLILSYHCPTIILYYPTTILYCPSIILYYPSIVLSYPGIILHYSTIMLYCPTIILYCPSIILYYPTIVLYYPAIILVLLYTFYYLLRLQLQVLSLIALKNLSILQFIKSRSLKTSALTVFIILLYL